MMSPVESRAIKTCFVSAPQDTSLTALRAALLAHGIRPLIPQDLLAETDLASETQMLLREADLVIGVITAEEHSSKVLFELGQAFALGRQIMVIVPPKSDWALPFSLHRTLVLRTDPNNRQAIDFALDQLQAAPKESTRTTTKRSFESKGLGAETDTLIQRLQESLQSNRYDAFERVIADAIRKSGTDVVVESPQRDRGADFAVWSDVLESFVGNPLLVETKLHIQDSAAAQRTFTQLSSYVESAGTRWALLIYGLGPQSNALTNKSPYNVLVTSAESLLEALRTKGFPEIVRDMRNKRVHSVRP